MMPRAKTESAAPQRPLRGAALGKPASERRVALPVRVNPRMLAWIDENVGIARLAAARSDLVELAIFRLMAEQLGEKRAREVLEGR